MLTSISHNANPYHVIVFARDLNHDQNNNFVKGSRVA